MCCPWRQWLSCQVRYQLLTSYVPPLLPRPIKQLFIPTLVATLYSKFTLSSDSICSVCWKLVKLKVCMTFWMSLWPLKIPLSWVTWLCYVMYSFYIKKISTNQNNIHLVDLYILSESTWSSEVSILTSLTVNQYLEPIPIKYNLYLI